MTELDETDKAILRAIDEQPLGAAGPSVIGEAIGKERSFVFHRLKRLQAEGIIENPQDGLYAVATDYDGQSDTSHAEETNDE